MKTVEFFFDCASPYTYLAATQVGALAQRTGAELLWRPFLLGGTFKATGNSPPATVPAKGRYMLTDLQLWARKYQVPFQFPKMFPINSLLPQRLACALPADQVGAFALKIMTAYWSEGAEIHRAEVLGPMLGELGLDAETLLAATASEEVKARLKANSEEAVQRGAFGAPTFFVGKTQFFGNDRLDLMEAVLTGALDAG